MQPPVDPERAGVTRVERLDVISLDDVIGRPVHGSDDAQIGSVANVYADLAAHQLRYALIDVGGFLGIGSRRVLVPFAALSWTDERLYLQVARDILEAAPAWRDEDALDSHAQAEAVRYWDAGRDTT